MRPLVPPFPLCVCQFYGSWFSTFSAFDFQFCLLWHSIHSNFRRQSGSTRFTWLPCWGTTICCACWWRTEPIFSSAAPRRGGCRAHDDHEFEAAMGLNGLNQAFDADMTNHNEVMRHFIRDFVDGDPKNGHFHGKMMPLTVTIHFS